MGGMKNGRRRGFVRLLAARLVLLGLVGGLSGNTRALAADATLPEFLPVQPLSEGKPVFDERGCRSCHRVGEEKMPPLAGPDLRGTAALRDFTAFASSLWNHRVARNPGEAPVVATPASINAEDMARLAAYLFYVDFLGKPGDAVRGREIAERASCFRCHQIGGKGGTVGPRLDELKDVITAFFLSQVLWNHGPEMAAKMQELGVERPPLTGQDIADIVALIAGDTPATRQQELAYSQAGDPSAGKIAFTEKGCVKCHAIASRGGTVGPDLGAVPEPMSVTDLTAALWNHGPKMWAKMNELGTRLPRLSDRDSADLLSYLHYVQYMGTSGDAAKGRELFREKGCSACHAAGGDGAKTAPDLARSAAARSPIVWAAAMWNHPFEKSEDQSTAAATPRFERDEMRDLVGYLRARGGAK